MEKFIDLITRGKGFTDDSGRGDFYNISSNGLQPSGNANLRRAHQKGQRCLKIRRR